MSCAGQSGARTLVRRRDASANHFPWVDLFKFQKGTEGAKEGEDLGQLTAWLVSDPKYQDMPLHTTSRIWD